MRQMGAFQEQLRANAETKEKICAMQEEVNRLAEQCVCMDELKKAFFARRYSAQRRPINPAGADRRGKRNFGKNVRRRYAGKV